MATSLYEQIPQHSTSPVLHWIGMDVAKSSFDAAVVRAGQHYDAATFRDVPVHTFARTRAGVKACLAWLRSALAEGVRPEHTRVCMEATGNYSTQLATWLLEISPGITPAIVNPHYTAAFIKSLGLRAKTDSLEARALAFYGAERQPVPYEPLSRAQAELRELSRSRDHLVRQEVALKNHAAELTGASRDAEQTYRRLIRQLQSSIARIEQRILRLLTEHPKLGADVVQLQTIDGVGPVTSVTVVAELGDLRRFTHARQLSAFVGISPSIVQSGSSVHLRPKLCKRGNPRVRKVLFMAAMAAIQKPGILKDTYDRLLAQGKEPMLALGAIMRKLLVLMRAILINGTTYNPGLLPCSNGGIDCA